METQKITTTHIRPIDYTIPIGKPKIPEHDLTVNELLQYFSYEEAMAIGFVPIMLGKLVFRYTESFLAYKNLPTKTHARQLRNIMKDYDKSFLTELSLSSIYKLDKHYDDFLELCHNDRVKLRFAVEHEVKKAYPQYDWKQTDVCTYSHLARLMIEAIFAYEKQTDKKVSERLKAPVTARRNDWINAMYAIIIDLTERWAIPESENISVGVKIIVKQAELLTKTFK